VSIQKFKPSSLYEAKGAGKYRFRISTDYAEGAYLADCWQCDAGLNLRPGYENSPVPVHVNELKRLVREKVEVPSRRPGGWLR